MSKFSKSLNPRNIEISFSDIRIRIRFTFESSFWISVSGCKLTILPDIQLANRMVIISAGYSLHPRECGPKVVQGPGGVTRSPTLLGPVLVWSEQN